MPIFRELLSQHIASSLLKQQALSEFLGDHHWNLSLDSGMADFGGGRVYPAQVIGTESALSATWLWGWANEASGIPAQLLTCAAKLRELGEKSGIAELTQPEVGLDQVNGHLFAMVACGVCRADAYYRGPYDSGAVFFLIHQSPLPRRPRPSPLSLINMMSAVIAQYDVDHKLMVQSLLQQQGYTMTEDGAKTAGVSPDNQKIVVEFDSLGRIANLETAMTAPPVKKPWWQLGQSKTS